MTNSVFNIGDSFVNSLNRTSVILMNSNMELTPEIIRLEIKYTLRGMASGNFILNDVDENVYDKYPLVSGEFLFISIISPESEVKVITEMFIISEVFPIGTDVSGANNKNKFRISFVSTNTIINEMLMISKGYPGPNSTSVIVKKILEEFFQYGTDTNNKVYQILESETIIEDFIIPYCHPFDIIRKLKDLSIPIDSKDAFLFYEEPGGINFVSGSSLFGRAPVYKLNRSNVSSYKSGIPMVNIKNDKFISGANLLSSVKRGGLGGTYYHFNSINKEIVENKYTPTENFFDGMPTISNNSFFKSDYYKASTTSYYLPLTKDSSAGSAYAMRKVRTDVFETLKLKADINGTVDIQLGNTVYVEFILGPDKLNLWYTGTWLVSEYKLIFMNEDTDVKAMNKQTLKTELILSKDGYGTIPRDIKDEANLINISKNINNDLGTIDVKSGDKK